MIRWYLRWYYFKEETKGIDVSIIIRTIIWKIERL